VALSAKVGSFALNTSLGTQAVTGIGFQPKAIIFFSATRATAAGTSTDMGQMLGFATSSSARGVVSAWHDEAAFSIGKRIAGDRCISGVLSSGSVDYDADFSSFDADGFTVNVTDAPASAFVVCYLALGGADLTNAKVGNFVFDTDLGTQAVTGVGFQPECLLFAHTATAGALPQASADLMLAYGVATPNGNEGCLYHKEHNANPTNVGQAQRTDAALISGTSSAIDALATVSTFDTDGFTLNWSDAPAAAYNCIYLALRGGQYKVGAETQKTSTGTKATTGVGFQPRSLFFFGYNHTAQSTIKTDTARTSIGASDGTNDRSVWAGGEDNKTPAAATNEESRLSTTKAFMHATEVGDALLAEADLTTLGADGFTLDWTTADATAREFIYLAAGDAVAAGGGGGGHRNMLTLGVG
jgi:hypothetical protein